MSARASRTIRGSLPVSTVARLAVGERDLIESYVGALGGWRAVTDAQLSDIRRAAELTARAEQAMPKSRMPPFSARRRLAVANPTRWLDEICAGWGARWGVHDTLSYVPSSPMPLILLACASAALL